MSVDETLFVIGSHVQLTPVGAVGEIVDYADENENAEVYVDWGEDEITGELRCNLMLVER